MSKRIKNYPFFQGYIPIQTVDGEPPKDLHNRKMLLLNHYIRLVEKLKPTTVFKIPGQFSELEHLLEEESQWRLPKLFLYPFFALGWTPNQKGTLCQDALMLSKHWTKLL